jgi:glycosyltransferase involved in cell wall biosynthesis
VAETSTDRTIGPVVSPLLLGMGWFPDQAGGLNRYVRQLHEALRDFGDAPRAVVLGPVTDLRPGVVVASERSATVLRRIRGVLEAQRALSTEVDVVDCHFPLYGLFPVLRARRRRTPCVAHFHGPWAGESRATGDGWAKARVKRAVEQLVYRRVDEIIVLSGAFKRVLVEEYGVSPWRVHVVPPGVDLESFSPGDRKEARARLGVPEDAWVALSVRRLVPRMGLDVLLDAWQEALFTDGDALLLVVGEGPACPELEARAKRLGLAGRVRFLGAVSEEELVTCYRAADVSVVPSISLEGFGLVVLEALACGTPVIASDVGGLPETLRALDRRLVVPPGDSAALGGRLAGIRDGTLPLPQPSRCRSFAERFSWQSVAASHHRLYRKALTTPPERKIRVAYLNHSGKLSGGELALLRLLQALPDVEAHVILAEEGPLVGRLIGAGISVEVLPLPGSVVDVRRAQVTPGRLPLRHAVGAVAYSVRLARRLRRLQPDLVHTNSLKAALYGGAAARLAGVPVVWHVRDRLAPDYLPRPAVRLVRAAARLLPTAIIANSEATRATLGPAAGRATVVPSPVDPSLLHLERDARAPGSGLRIGMIGRIAPFKGQHVFIEAFARAFREGDGIHEAVIVGSPLFGEHVYEQEVRQLALNRGVGERVRFAGFSEDIAAELTGLDILVHASVTPEPFGQVVVEGMAAGLPVIASAGGGPSEIIDDGVTGLLYPPGDADRLAQALRRLARDEELRARLGERAAERAKDFVPERAATSIMEAYRYVLNGVQR